MGGTVIAPFMRMETDEDIGNFIALSERIIDWWTDNGFEHERVGETIERIGLKHFLDGVGLPVSVEMVTRPRSNPYYKSAY
jgi:sulfite reductase alpha subunit